MHIIVIFLILIKLIGLQGSFFGAPNRFRVIVSARGVAMVSLPVDVAEEVYEAVVSEVQSKVCKGSHKHKKFVFIVAQPLRVVARPLRGGLGKGLATKKK